MFVSQHEDSLILCGDAALTRLGLTDEAAVADAVRGADAVLATLCPKIFGGPRDLPLASGTGTVLAAVRSASFALLGWLPATRSMVNETVEVGEVFRGSDRDWTLVVVTAPHDEPGTGRVKVRTGSGTGDRVGSRISRTDLAQFMLAQADDLRYARQELRISN
jgi:hypothetical protein